MIIDYQALNQSHVDLAVQLVMAAYQEEKLAVPCLPDSQSLSELLRKEIAHLFSRGSGFAALSGGALVGFLAGYEIGPLFGSSPGIYCPVSGHGAVRENRTAIYQGLYAKAAQMWVEKGHLSHAVTLFAHARETVDTWFWLGFGMRCVDSIRKAEPVQAGPDISVCKMSAKDVPELAQLHREHNFYYGQSPIFMPREEEDPVQDLLEWLDKPGHHLWAAYLDGVPRGYMRIQPEAESFVSLHPDVMNITGAYVDPSTRRSGIGAALLNAVNTWLVENRFPLCGVDFEAINVTGSQFWNKHFTPYTYSVVRRIDERIVG